MVMKSFVSELTGVNMLANVDVKIQEPSWAGYYIQVLHINTEDELFQVCSKAGVAIKSPWQTVEGATAHCELLAGGYWKE